MAKPLRNISILLVLWLCFAPNLQEWSKSEASTQSKDPVDEAEALLALSEQQHYDNHVLALQTAQQALLIWQSLGDDDGIARTYAQIGDCYFAQNDLPGAVQNYEEALQIWRDLNNPQQQAGILIQLSYVEIRKGEWSNSILLFSQAQSLIDEENEPFKMGQIANGLGHIFNENGLPESALIQYKRALDYLGKTSDTSDDMVTIWALGSTYHLLGNYPEALTHLRQALASEAPDSLFAALCNEYLGRVYISMGEHAVALECLQSALTAYTRAGNPLEEARVLGLMGQVYQQQRKPESARRHYRQALASFGGLSDRINQAAIYYALGRLELKTRNYDAAEDYLRQSLEVTENIRRVSTSTDLTAAFSASVYARYESYIECLMHKHQAQQTKDLAVRAFEISELARGRSLAEVLRVTETNLTPGLDPQLAAQEKALRQSLRLKEEAKVALLSTSNKRAELDALEVELARLEQEHKQVIETIEALSPSYKQLTRPVAWDLRRIQEQVITDDQTVLLEYCLGSEASYVWVVTRDSIKSYNLPSRELITDMVQKTYKLLASPTNPDNPKEVIEAVQGLGRMILSPVAAELNKDRIIIVADGALHYIPFQVLPTPQAPYEPLVSNYEIINAPSASILGELRKEAERRQPAKLLAAFGDPVFETNYGQRKDKAESENQTAGQALGIARWHQALRDIELKGDSFDPSRIQPLFSAKGELTNLREVASGGETFVASDFIATRELLLNMDLTQYAILHFATHGLIDPKRPENSCLVLSTVDLAGKPQNGFVGLQDIYGLRAPVDLVVLSACQTALGKDVRGEGLLGLTRGFMYAGASSVVASLWKVDDEATAELMRQFYTNLLQNGMTPAAALGGAQNSIRQRPEWQAPFYWAGFTLQGEYTRVIKAQSANQATTSYRNLIIGAAFILLAAIALWHRQRRLRPQQESR